MPSPRAIDSGFASFLREHYARSLKSSRSDEWINTFAIRPLAAMLVWVFYLWRWKPVWVVWLGAAVGLSGAIVLAVDPSPDGMRAAGFLLLLKNVLDAADGQLARATDQVDRLGRFADSVSDFFVNAAMGLALSAPLAARVGWQAAVLLGAACGLCVMLQCSLFVFYQVGYLAAVGKSPVNRTDESAERPDPTAPLWEGRLHAIYLVLYGWQDRWMARIDSGLRAFAGVKGASRADEWAADAVGLRLTSFLGLGTSLTGWAICLILGRADWAAFWILIVLNLVVLIALLYRALFFSLRIGRSKSR